LRTLENLGWTEKEFKTGSKFTANYWTQLTRLLSLNADESSGAETNDSSSGYSEETAPLALNVLTQNLLEPPTTVMLETAESI
jgi:hypothetical protein